MCWHDCELQSFFERHSRIFMTLSTRVSPPSHFDISSHREQLMHKHLHVSNVCGTVVRAMLYVS
jgi:hypothetical protein